MVSVAKSISDWKVRNPGRFPSALKPAALAWFNVSRSFRALPSFVIIGAPKCGTTSFFSYLSQHPQIIPSMDKEPSYLRSNKFRSIAGYRANFPLRANLPAGGITGEGTTTYLYDEEVCERLSRLLPDTKLFVMLRNPAERALSQYHHFVRRGVETKPILEVFDGLLSAYADWDIDTALPLIDSSIAASDYLKYGIYAKFLPTWSVQINSGQLTHIYFEQFIQNPKQALKEAFDRLRVDADFCPELRVFKEGSHRADDATLQQRLVEFYAPFNQLIEPILGEQPGW